MKVFKTYDAVEVGRILKLSEEGTGHAEERHSMGGSGKRRDKIDDEGLINRNIEEASAYVNGHQIPATVACLNSAEGQLGLKDLDEGAKRVTIKIHFGSLMPVPPPPWPFSIRVAQADAEFTLPGTNLTTYGLYNVNNVQPSHGVVVMEKKSTGLHIVTSYPMRTAPGNLGAASGRETRWK